MRKNFSVLLLALIPIGLLAQTTNTNPPTPGQIETPAAAPAATNAGAAEDIAPAAPTHTNAPAAKSKKPAKKKPARTVEQLRSVPLVAGPASVLASNVNVRGQAKLNSEVVTRLTKDQQVDVLEEIKIKDSAPDEPSAWAKIRLPAGAHVWLNSSYVDASNQTVKASRLNVRSGPGENYSILGRLERGEAVKPITSKGDWTQIEAPTNAYAFVAAQYLGQEAAPTPPSTPTEPTPAPTTVAEQPVVAPPPADQPPVTAPTETAAAKTPAPAPAPPAQPEPPPKRIVQREGIVKGTVSIQAPTRYALVSPDSGRTINYLYSESKDLDLGRWKGLRIVVTGEEGLDERWRNTPVITIQRIQVLDER